MRKRKVKKQYRKFNLYEQSSFALLYIATNIWAEWYVKIKINNRKLSEVK